MESAVDAFDDAVTRGKLREVLTLNDLIAILNIASAAIKNVLPLDNDASPSSIAKGTRFAPAQAVEDFKDVIDPIAEKVHSSRLSSSKITDYIFDLEIATAEFMAVVQVGMGAPVDTSVLLATIDKALNVKVGVYAITPNPSKDQISAGVVKASSAKDIHVDMLFVDLDVMEDLDHAIEIASEHAAAPYNITAVEDAIAELEDSIWEFEREIQSGEKEDLVETADLRHIIDSVATEMSHTIASDLYAYNIADTVNFMSLKDYNFVTSALGKAYEILAEAEYPSDPDLDIEEMIDEAIYTLENIYDEVNVKQGEIDVADIVDLIEEAMQIDVLVISDGQGESDVPPGVEAVNLNSWLTFSKALSAAQSALDAVLYPPNVEDEDDPALLEQTDIDVFATDLQTQLDDLNSGILEGAALSGDDIEDLLDDAYDLKDSLIGSNLAADKITKGQSFVSEDDFNSLLAAIAVAETVADDVRDNSISDNEHTAAVNALQSTITNIKTTQAEGTLQNSRQYQELIDAIASAYETLGNVEVYPDGTKEDDVAEGLKFISKTDKDWFTGEITTAEGIAKDSASEDDDLEDAKDDLDKTIRDFDRVIETGSNDTLPAITKTIADARTAMRGIQVTDYSKETSQIEYGIQYASQADVNSLLAAITKAEINEDVRDLEDAIDLFKSTIKTGTYINTDSLTSAIASAVTLLSDVAIFDDDTDVESVDRGHRFTTQSEKDDLLDAIDTAQNTSIDEPRDLDNTLEDLADAVNNFKDSIQVGVFVDTIAIKEKIDSAWNLSRSIAVNDNPQDDISASIFYVTSTDLGTLLSAIVDATTTANSSSSTADDLILAESALSSAMETFNQAVKHGKRSQELDAQPLIDEISRGRTLLRTTVESDDGSGVSKWHFYASNEDIADFSEALLKAEAAREKAKYESEITIAATEMREANDDFNDARSPGSEIIIPDAMANVLNIAKGLVAACADDLASLTPAKYILKTDDTAIEVPQGVQFVSMGAFNALETALLTADGIVGTSSALAEVEAGVAPLQLAINDFQSRIAVGIKITPIDTAALETAITNAEDAKFGIAVSTANKTAMEDGVQFVHPTALEALNFALARAMETLIDALTAPPSQQGILPALVQQRTTDLETATTTFADAIQTGSLADMSELRDKIDDAKRARLYKDGDLTNGKIHVFEKDPLFTDADPTSDVRGTDTVDEGVHYVSPSIAEKLDFAITQAESIAYPASGRSATSNQSDAYAITTENVDTAVDTDARVAQLRDKITTLETPIQSAAKAVAISDTPATEILDNAITEFNAAVKTGTATKADVDAELTESRGAIAKDNLVSTDRDPATLDSRLEIIDTAAFEHFKSFLEQFASFDDQPDDPFDVARALRDIPVEHDKFRLTITNGQIDTEPLRNLLDAVKIPYDDIDWSTDQLDTSKIIKILTVDDAQDVDENVKYISQDNADDAKVAIKDAEELLIDVALGKDLSAIVAVSTSGANVATTMAATETHRDLADVTVRLQTAQDLLSTPLTGSAKVGADSDTVAVDGATLKALVNFAKDESKDALILDLLAANVHMGVKYFVSDAESKLFKEALESAESFSDDAADPVDTAREIANLRDALQIIQTGAMKIPAYKENLVADVKEAQELLGAISTTANDLYWAESTAIDAFKAEIEQAELAINTAVSNEEMEAAVLALEDAIIAMTPHIRWNAAGHGLTIADVHSLAHYHVDEAIEDFEVETTDDGSEISVPIGTSAFSFVLLSDAAGTKTTVVPTSGILPIANIGSRSALDEALSNAAKETVTISVDTGGIDIKPVAVPSGAATAKSAYKISIPSVEALSGKKSFSIIISYKATDDGPAIARKWTFKIKETEASADAAQDRLDDAEAVIANAKVIGSDTGGAVKASEVATGIKFISPAAMIELRNAMKVIELGGDSKAEIKRLTKAIDAVKSGKKDGGTTINTDLEAAIAYAHELLDTSVPSANSGNEDLDGEDVTGNWFAAADRDAADETRLALYEAIGIANRKMYSGSGSLGTADLADTAGTDGNPEPNDVADVVDALVNATDEFVDLLFVDNKPVDLEELDVAVDILTSAGDPMPGATYKNDDDPAKVDVRDFITIGVPSGLDSMKLRLTPQTGVITIADGTGMTNTTLVSATQVGDATMIDASWDASTKNPYFTIKLSASANPAVNNYMRVNISSAATIGSLKEVLAHTEAALADIIIMEDSTPADYIIVGTNFMTVEEYIKASRAIVDAKEIIDAHTDDTDELDIPDEIDVLEALTTAVNEIQIGTGVAAGLDGDQTAEVTALKDLIAEAEALAYHSTVANSEVVDHDDEAEDLNKETIVDKYWVLKNPGTAADHFEVTTVKDFLEARAEANTIAYDANPFKTKTTVEEAKNKLTGEYNDYVDELYWEEDDDEVDYSIDLGAFVADGSIAATASVPDNIVTITDAFGATISDATATWGTDDGKITITVPAGTTKFNAKFTAMDTQTPTPEEALGIYVGYQIGDDGKEDMALSAIDVPIVISDLVNNEFSVTVYHDFNGAIEKASRSVPNKPTISKTYTVEVKEKEADLKVEDLEDRLEYVREIIKKPKPTFVILSDGVVAEDVHNDRQFISVTGWMELEAAINQAVKTLSSSPTDPADIKSAIQALSAAIEKVAAGEMVKPSTTITDAKYLEPIENALILAEATRKDDEEAKIGTATGDADYYWATEAAQQAFHEAIAVANTVIYTAENNPSNVEIEAAITNLADAQATFVKALHWDEGTPPTAMDEASLPFNEIKNDPTDSIKDFSAADTNNDIKTFDYEIIGTTNSFGPADLANPENSYALISETVHRITVPLGTKKFKINLKMNFTPDTTPAPDMNVRLSDNNNNPAGENYYAEYNLTSISGAPITPSATITDDPTYSITVGMPASGNPDERNGKFKMWVSHDLAPVPVLDADTGDVDPTKIEEAMIFEIIVDDTVSLEDVQKLIEEIEALMWNKSTSPAENILVVLPNTYTGSEKKPIEAANYSSAYNYIQAWDKITLTNTLREAKALDNTSSMGDIKESVEKLTAALATIVAGTNAADISTDTETTDIISKVDDAQAIIDQIIEVRAEIDGKNVGREVYWYVRDDTVAPNDLRADGNRTSTPSDAPLVREDGIDDSLQLLYMAMGALNNIIYSTDTLISSTDTVKTNFEGALDAFYEILFWNSNKGNVTSLDIVETPDNIKFTDKLGRKIPDISWERLQDRYSAIEESTITVPQGTSNFYVTLTPKEEVSFDPSTKDDFKFDTTDMTDPTTNILKNGDAYTIPIGSNTDFDGDDYFKIIMTHDFDNDAGEFSKMEDQLQFDIKLDASTDSDELKADLTARINYVEKIVTKSKDGLTDVEAVAPATGSVDVAPTSVPDGILYVTAGAQYNLDVQLQKAKHLNSSSATVPVDETHIEAFTNAIEEYVAATKEGTGIAASTDQGLIDLIEKCEKLRDSIAAVDATPPVTTITEDTSGKVVGTRYYVETAQKREFNTAIAQANAVVQAGGDVATAKTELELARRKIIDEIAWVKTSATPGSGPFTLDMIAITADATGTAADNFKNAAEYEITDIKEPVVDHDDTDTSTPANYTPTMTITVPVGTTTFFAKFEAKDLTASGIEIKLVDNGSGDIAPVPPYGSTANGEVTGSNGEVKAKISLDQSSSSNPAEFEIVLTHPNPSSGRPAIEKRIAVTVETETYPAADLDARFNDRLEYIRAMLTGEDSKGFYVLNNDENATDVSKDIRYIGVSDWMELEDLLNNYITPPPATGTVAELEDLTRLSEAIKVGKSNVSPSTGPALDAALNRTILLAQAVRKDPSDVTTAVTSEYWDDDDGAKLIALNEAIAAANTKRYTGNSLNIGDTVMKTLASAEADMIEQIRWGAPTSSYHLGVEQDITFHTENSIKDKLGAEMDDVIKIDAANPAITTSYDPTSGDLNYTVAYDVTIPYKATPGYSFDIGINPANFNDSATITPGPITGTGTGTAIEISEATNVVNPDPSASGGNLVFETLSGTSGTSKVTHKIPVTVTADTANLTLKFSKDTNDFTPPYGTTDANPAAITKKIVYNFKEAKISSVDSGALATLIDHAKTLMEKDDVSKENKLITISSAADTKDMDKDYNYVTVYERMDLAKALAEAEQEQTISGDFVVPGITEATAKRATQAYSDDILPIATNVPDAYKNLISAIKPITSGSHATAKVPDTGDELDLAKEVQTLLDSIVISPNSTGGTTSAGAVIGDNQYWVVYSDDGETEAGKNIGTGLDDNDHDDTIEHLYDALAEVNEVLYADGTASVDTDDITALTEAKKLVMGEIYWKHGGKKTTLDVANKDAEGTGPDYAATNPHVVFHSPAVTSNGLDAADRELKNFKWGRAQLTLADTTTTPASSDSDFDTSTIIIPAGTTKFDMTLELMPDVKLTKIEVSTGSPTLTTTPTITPTIPATGEVTISIGNAGTEITDESEFTVTLEPATGASNPNITNTLTFTIKTDDTPEMGDNMKALANDWINKSFYFTDPTPTPNTVKDDVYYATVTDLDNLKKAVKNYPTAVPPTATATTVSALTQAIEAYVAAVKKGTKTVGVITPNDEPIVIQTVELLKEIEKGTYSSSSLIEADVTALKAELAVVNQAYYTGNKPDYTALEKAYNDVAAEIGITITGITSITSALTDSTATAAPPTTATPIGLGTDMFTHTDDKVVTGTNHELTITLPEAFRNASAIYPLKVVLTTDADVTIGGTGVTAKTIAFTQDNAQEGVDVTLSETGTGSPPTPTVTRNVKVKIAYGDPVTGTGDPTLTAYTTAVETYVNKVLGLAAGTTLGDSLAGMTMTNIKVIDGETEDKVYKGTNFVNRSEDTIIRNAYDAADKTAGTADETKLNALLAALAPIKVGKGSSSIIVDDAATDAIDYGEKMLAIAADDAYEITSSSASAIDDLRKTIVTENTKIYTGTAVATNVQKAINEALVKFSKNVRWDGSATGTGGSGSASDGAKEAGLSAEIYNPGGVAAIAESTTVAPVAEMTATDGGALAIATGVGTVPIVNSQGATIFNAPVKLTKSYDGSDATTDAKYTGNAFAITLPNFFEASTSTEIYLQFAVDKSVTVKHGTIDTSINVTDSLTTTPDTATDTYYEAEITKPTSASEKTVFIKQSHPTTSSTSADPEIALTTKYTATVDTANNEAFLEIARKVLPISASSSAELANTFLTVTDTAAATLSDALAEITDDSSASATELAAVLDAMDTVETGTGTGTGSTTPALLPQVNKALEIAHKHGKDSSSGAKYWVDSGVKKTFMEAIATAVESTSASADVTALTTAQNTFLGQSKLKGGSELAFGITAVDNLKAVLNTAAGGHTLTTSLSSSTTTDGKPTIIFPSGADSLSFDINVEPGGVIELQNSTGSAGSATLSDSTITITNPVAGSEFELTISRDGISRTDIPITLKEATGTRSIYIPDVALADALAVAGVDVDEEGNASESDMLTLTSLDADGYGIVDLTGLESAKNLTYLNLSNNQLKDVDGARVTTPTLGRNINALAKLPKLETLLLANNPLITDISPIAGISNALKVLDLTGTTNISDGIATIGKFSNLTTLAVDAQMFVNEMDDMIEAIAAATTKSPEIKVIITSDTMSKEEKETLGEQITKTLDDAMADLGVATPEIVIPTDESDDENGDENNNETSDGDAVEMNGVIEYLGEPKYEFTEVNMNQLRYDFERMLVSAPPAESKDVNIEVAIVKDAKDEAKLDIAKSDENAYAVTKVNAITSVSKFTNRETIDWSAPHVLDIYTAQGEYIESAEIATLPRNEEGHKTEEFGNHGVMELYSRDLRESFYKEIEISVAPDTTAPVVEFVGMPKLTFDSESADSVAIGHYVRDNLKISDNTDFIDDTNITLYLSTAPVTNDNSINGVYKLNANVMDAAGNVTRIETVEIEITDDPSEVSILPADDYAWTTLIETAICGDAPLNGNGDAPLNENENKTQATTEAIAVVQPRVTILDGVAKTAITLRDTITKLGRFILGKNITPSVIVETEADAVTVELDRADVQTLASRPDASLLVKTDAAAAVLDHGDLLAMLATSGDAYTLVVKDNASGETTVEIFFHNDRGQKIRIPVTKTSATLTNAPRYMY